MITCPVCEHQQAAGSACEVCGLELEAGRGTDAPVAPLEGLEPTLQDASGLVLEERLPDLEPTLQDAAGAVAPDLGGLELEPTLAAPVEAAGEVVPDLERIGEGIPDDGPTLQALTVVCRYCRTEAAPGERRCGRCGMRLPESGARPTAAAAAAPALCSCGTPVTRSVCPACGARNATA